MDWDARMRSALSASRGLAHLHSEHKLAHGNVKSSNVLLRPDLDAAALSDFSLHPIYAPTAEEEMVALLQVAMACVATVPDARPDAPDVVRMIEEIGASHGQTTTEESARATTSEEERSRGTPPAAPTP
ncbi:unnamed protein product [Triticum turgidum subsp. durum]|uniref:Protein kinase domain-containing protein n=1 Tax=Triticum turgidum subsp. durum TaxID=4567 RepID=A0A9R0WYI4_TRITD|nr:unnamed protein product [Triticum turgidum subsp. durum]